MKTFCDPSVYLAFLQYVALCTCVLCL